MTAVDTALTPQLVEDFRRDGFVVVPDLLSRRRAGAGSGRRSTRRSPGAAGTTRGRWPRSRATSRASSSARTCGRTAPSVRPLTFHPLIAETAARLLGVGAVRLWHDQALYKEPGGRETDPHQDQPYWPIVETNTITAWIPFDGSTLESGAMGYLPGSHRLGRARVRQHLHRRRGEDPLAPGASWPGSSRCSSRCRPGRSPSTTA